MKPRVAFHLVFGVRRRGGGWVIGPFHDVYLREVLTVVTSWRRGGSLLVLAGHRLAQQPQAGHDLVPVQVGALQEPPLVPRAGVAPAAVEQAPVVKGHDVAYDHDDNNKNSKSEQALASKATYNRYICPTVSDTADHRDHHASNPSLWNSLPAHI